MLGVFADIIKDQLDRKFIEQVPSEPPPKGCHYIPYHYVKKDSSTTPIRIVYNCSNKGWNSVSFNDCVETGAPLHNDQVHLLIRFRAHAIDIVADVEKAFHHIELHESDRDYLRWMWLSNPQDPDSPLVTYRFKVVRHLFSTLSSCTIYQEMVLKWLLICSEVFLLTMLSPDVIVKLRPKVTFIKRTVSCAVQTYHSRLGGSVIAT
jgi:hypothetical protein